MQLKHSKYIWIFGLLGTAFIILAPIVLLVSSPTEAKTSAWDFVDQDRRHTSHATLITGEFTTGGEVTQTCLTCHEDASHEVMGTAHWNWKGEPVLVNDRTEPIAIGKANLFNNFCIGIQSNWAGCTRCHAGYGWTDANFDFTNQENVDCLVCHDQSGTYVKAAGGQPAEGVNLLVAAQSVGTPSRMNCGYCHFNGGGGNAVKHGDLDESLYYPSEEIDVHMGQYNFLCVDCHKTDDHQIMGRSISVSVDDKNQLACTDCHQGTIHTDERINTHTDALACQTCHIPLGAVQEPTKMTWDWSTAGQDLGDDPHTYLKIKGSFHYESGIVPEYAWFDGTVDRYLMGDVFDPTQVLDMNPIHGNIDDPDSLIYPFKVHRGKQPYDTVFNYLLQPQTAGEGGYWTTFDWQSSLERGAELSGLPFSGSYGFAETRMNWVLSHMVAPKEQALQCTDCHSEGGRMDWEALGYEGDPMFWGGR